MGEVFNGFFANRINGDKLFTAFNDGLMFTEMPYSRLVEGVEGTDDLLNEVLGKLLGYKSELEKGHTVNVHLEWERSDNLRKNFNWVKVEKVEIKKTKV